jgi:hypothetical protein
MSSTIEVLEPNASPSIPWLKPGAASSAVSLPSMAASGSLSLAFPFMGDFYQPGRDGALELDVVTPSCLTIPIPVDARSPQQPPTLSNPPDGARGYMRQSSANFPWHMRYANFQGALETSRVAPDDQKIVGVPAEEGKILGSPTSPEDKIVGIQPDGEKILGSPSNGEKISDGPPMAHAADPNVSGDGWAAIRVVQPDARNTEAQQVQPRQPPDHEIPEVLGPPPPPPKHSRARARSVDATAGAAVSQVVLERRRRRARHQILDDID